MQTRYNFGRDSDLEAFSYNPLDGSYKWMKVEIIDRWGL